MIGIGSYINENMRQHPLWCEIVLSLFKSEGTQTKETVASMIISLCDVEGRLKKFSDYLMEEYPKEYLAYQPGDDEFLSKENNEKICGQIAEFIIKYVKA